MQLNNHHLTRQLDIIPSKILDEPITVIGAGAVGGWTTLSLAKMGFKYINVIDFDRVSVENMNSQYYGFSDIGQMKVDALRAKVLDMTGTTITTSSEPYTQGIFKGIIISAVDSMKVRRLIWENHGPTAFNTRVIIDPRMGAESAALYVTKPFDSYDREAYEASLSDDSEAVQEACTAKATIYTANLLAGLVCKAVKDILTRPDYLRTAVFNIKENQLVCFKQQT